MDCLIFPSENAGTRCAKFLKNSHGEEILTEILNFSLSGVHQIENIQWARFFAVIYPKDFQKTAEKFWAIFGDGISSRHAEFCLERFDWMGSECCNGMVLSDGEKPQPAPRASWTEEVDMDVKSTIRSRVAKLISSDDPSMPSIVEKDVLLYPKGMCAISAVARALVPDEDHLSEVVVYG